VTGRETLVQTRLEDLQSEIEAGSRKLQTIGEDAAAMRQELLANHLVQASLAGRLLRRIVELKACVEQQRAVMHELRQAIRGSRRDRQVR
jgi:hypothetical protein